MSKNKKPKLNSNFAVKVKIPKIAQNPDSYFEKTPSWCFSQLDKNSQKWSISEVDFANDILPKLISFEQRKWSDIISDKKTQSLDKMR